jgi:Protein of unknown function (DUF1553)/Protein of unknown function (DUF1549)/Planctomycete cytochrome C
MLHPTAGSGPRPAFLALLAVVFVLPQLRAQDETMPPKQDGMHAGEHAGVALAPRGKGIDYLRDVRPILTQHCYGCHGPDEEQRATDLRFDLKASAFGDLGDGLHAVTPGDLAKSEMIARLVTDDADLKMPPPDEKDPISAAELAILKKWVEEGASWRDHWAFQPIVKVEPPAAGEGWAQNPIDRFISARHAAEGLVPNDPADREALVRRVSFDLTGLPPTPEEIDAFIADQKPGAYRRVVDRLLASERYGERQAQEWLDAARYADTDGYQADRGRSAWKWREWVVKAFNANKPFDEFTVEQLAGDLLPEPTLAQKIATGFNRNHPTNSEAGSEPDEYRSQYVIDRANTAATTFLGLTMGCAQCHDHKFDPISQKEFFGFYAYFNQVKEGAGYGRRSGPRLRVPNPDQAPHIAALEAELKTLKSRLEDPDPVADAAQNAWEARIREHLGDDVAWSVSEPIGLLSRNGAVLRRLEDGSILATGEAPVRDTYELTFKPGKGKISAIRIEVLPHESLPLGGSGRSRKGEFILSGLKMRLSSLSDSTDPPLVFVAKADTSLNQERPEFPGDDASSPGSIGSAIVADDGKDANSGSRRFGGGWRIIGDERMKEHEAILVPLETLVLNDSSVLRLTIEQNRQPFKTQIGRFRVSFAEDESIRKVMLPAHGKIWSAVGPFPAEDAAKAHSTDFEPEKGIAKDKALDLKATFAKINPPKPPAKGKEGDAKAKSKSQAASAKATAAAKPGASSASGPKSKDAKPSGKSGLAPGAKKGSPTGVSTKALAKAAPAKKAKPQVSDDAKTAAAVSPKPPQDFLPGVGLFGPVSAQAAPPKKGRATKSKAPSGAKGVGKGKKGGGKAKSSPDAKPATAAAKPAGSASESRRRSRPPEKLAWKEHRSWRDGRRIELAADYDQSWYLSRKIESTRARTVTMRFDGPDGVKAWLNGELIFQVEPPKATSSDARRSSRGRSSGSSDDRKVRLGLREGENELVVKVTFRKRSARSRRGRSFGGGNFNPEMFGNLSDEEIKEYYARQGGGGAKGSFTFGFSPEGEDVLNHEVVRALRATSPVDLVAKRDGDEEEKKREAQHRKVIRKWFRENLDPVGRMLARERRRLEGEKRSLERRMPETLVMEELPKEKMRKTQVFVRGDYRQRADEVKAHIPEILPDMPAEAPANRLGLARWIVSPENPLTARVLVNRIWKQYFGVGFVRTAEDFGVRSETPTHPALLDWLARDLIENDWDLKRLHRMIVTSATYQQSAKISPEALEKDPENRLLARGPRQRLSAEMVRDAALSAGGLIVHEIGGPSVRPYQPEGLWSEISSGMRYRRDKSEKQYRRGLYVYWKRGAPYPSMVTFDAAKREVCTVDRAETTTPLQALVLLNDPAYVEAAKMLGQRLVELADKDDAEKLAFGYRLCTGRKADAPRIAVLKNLLDSQRKHFAAKAKDAEKLLAVGDAKVDTKKHGATELAAWTAVGSALLNLDASLHR